MSVTIGYVFQFPMLTMYYIDVRVPRDELKSYGGHQRPLLMQEVWMKVQILHKFGSWACFTHCNQWQIIESEEEHFQPRKDMPISIQPGSGW